jgi:hypothetical protein
MLEPRLLLTTVAVLAPLVAAPVVARRKDGRTVSVIAAAISLVAIAVAVWFTAPAGGLLTVDSLAAAPALAFAFVMFGLFLTAPKNDVAGGECARLLMLREHDPGTCRFRRVRCAFDGPPIGLARR